MLDTILFDVDGTLIDTESVMIRSLQVALGDVLVYCIVHN